MKRTALILAGVIDFDLGVMAVAAQAQEQTLPPTVRFPTTSTDPAFPGAGAGGASHADRQVTAMQSGRTVASTCTDAREGFGFELPVGTCELCVRGVGGGSPPTSPPFAWPRKWSL